MKHYRILTGFLTAALLLGRGGVDVLVVDRQPAPYPQPRAVHLDDEALRVLQAAGVADAFAAVSRPMAGLRLLDSDDPRYTLLVSSSGLR